MRRVTLFLSLFALSTGGLLACSPGSTSPVVKIGLVAPFEGRYRAIGYEAIYAARLAIREINHSGGINGVRVELIALDDSGDRDMAIEQARKLALDPQVIAVIGHYRPDATSAAMEVYCAGSMPLLAVESDRLSHCPKVFALTPPAPALAPDDPTTFFFVATVPHPADVPAAATFVDAYNAIPIDGTKPGPIALQTYDAMYLLFDALARNIQSDGEPSREGMARALVTSNFIGLGGMYQFDAEGDRIEVQVYVYQYPQVTLLYHNHGPTHGP